MRISVVGAYGYTGKIICDELKKSGIHFNGIGRDRGKLLLLSEELKGFVQVFQLDIRNSLDIEKIIGFSDLIINCAGPFTEESPLLVERCAYEGKIYIDISGEVGFVKQSWEKLNEFAIKNRALIIHSCAFESLFVDLGVQCISKSVSKLQAVRSFYWFNNMVVSPGTKMTMKLSKFRDVQSIDRGLWTKENTYRNWKIGWDDNQQFHSIVYPLPEIAFMKWNYNVDSCCSFLLMEEMEAKFFQFEKFQKTVTLNDVDQLRSRKTEGPSESLRKAQKNIIIIQVVEEDGTTQYLSISSDDMYLITAQSVVYIVKKLLINPSEYKGVISPATVFRGVEKELFEKLGATLNEVKNIKCELI